MLASSYETMIVRFKLCIPYLKISHGRLCYIVKMKHKRTKPAKTKEQEAAEEGWIYVFGPKIRRGWESIWVEAAREGQEEDEGRALRLYTPIPIVYGPPGSSERCTCISIERGLEPKRDQLLLLD